MPPRGSYIDRVDDPWWWVRDEGDGGEERVGLLVLQLFVPHEVSQEPDAAFRPTRW